MSNSTNFFFRNRDEKPSKFFFISWLPKIYFSTLELLKKASLEGAIKQYNYELNDAITMCQLQNLNKKIIKKLEDVSLQFSNIPQASNLNDNCVTFTKK